MCSLTLTNRMTECSLLHISKHQHTKSKLSSCCQCLFWFHIYISLCSFTVITEIRKQHWWLTAGSPAWISLWRRQRWAIALPPVWDTKCGSAQLDSCWTALTSYAGAHICAPESTSVVVIVKPPDIKTYLCIYQSIQFPKTQSFSLHKTCLHTAKLVALCYVLDMLTHSLSQVVFEGYTAYTVLFVTPSNKSTIVFPFFSFPFRNTTASITHSASVAVIDNFLTLIPDKLWTRTRLWTMIGWGHSCSVASLLTKTWQEFIVL